MRNSKSLDPIARVAQQRERDAVLQLGHSMRQTEQHQRQLDELTSYWKQYMQKFQMDGKVGFSPVKMHDYQLFLSRLDSAITQQTQLVASSEEDCQQSQSDWHDALGYSRMIDKVVGSRRLFEAQQRKDREQRESDDRPKTLPPGRMAFT